MLCPFVQTYARLAKCSRTTCATMFKACQVFVTSNKDWPETSLLITKGSALRSVWRVGHVIDGFPPRRGLVFRQSSLLVHWVRNISRIGWSQRVSVTKWLTRWTCNRRIPSQAWVSIPSKLLLVHWVRNISRIGWSQRVSVTQWLTRWTCNRRIPSQAWVNIPSKLLLVHWVRNMCVLVGLRNRFERDVFTSQNITKISQNFLCKQRTPSPHQLETTPYMLNV